jgi:hypothetical protein
MLAKEKAAVIRSLTDDDGYIEPAAVVEEARDERSPLHSEFEWDDTRAAELHRLDTARSLIRFVRLEVEVEETTVLAPYYVTDPMRPPKTPQRYVELTRVARDREVAARVLNDELDRILAAIRRATNVAAALGMSAELSAMLREVERVRLTAAAKVKPRAKLPPTPPTKRARLPRSGARAR